MNRRINIMLPESTLAVLDRVTSRGNRSRLISRAVLHYVENRGTQILREQLKAGYQANAEESVKIALEWFPLEEEAWQRTHANRKGKK
jgi:metal-responsive CopG/Arc/MetJ family transcriptional regulator